MEEWLPPILTGRRAIGFRFILNSERTNTSMSNFQGIFPAIVSPVTSDGRLNEAAFRAVIEFNIQAGVQGFWVAGGTGESILLGDEVNQRIAEVVEDQSGGRVKNIMHVGAPTTARSLALAEHAAKVGVAAICCVPPFFYPRTDEEIIGFYRTVAAAADLPLFVYNLPSATGVEITPALMRKIRDEVPQLAGLKHSAQTFVNVQAFAKLGLSCLIGNKALMLPAMTIGATGCVDGPPVIVPERWVEIWQAYKSGDLAAAEAAQIRACQTWDKINSCGGQFHAIAKAALSERLGIDCGAPIPPGLPITSEQRATLRRCLDELGLIR